MNEVIGTHQGHLNDEARARRRVKNAGNLARVTSGEDTRPRGSKRWQTRLWLLGNRSRRGRA